MLARVFLNAIAVLVGAAMCSALYEADIVKDVLSVLETKRDITEIDLRRVMKNLKPGNHSNNPRDWD